MAEIGTVANALDEIKEAMFDIDFARTTMVSAAQFLEHSNVHPDLVKRTRALAKEVEDALYNHEREIENSIGLASQESETEA